MLQDTFEIVADTSPTGENATTLLKIGDTVKLGCGSPLMIVIDCHEEMACPAIAEDPKTGNWLEHPHANMRFLTVRWYSKRGYEVSVYPENCLERCQDSIVFDSPISNSSEILSRDSTDAYDA